MTFEVDLPALSEKDLRAFVVKRGDYFVSLFRKIKTGENQYGVSWNWLAFFLPLVWLAYRRRHRTIIALLLFFTFFFTVGSWAGAQAKHGSGLSMLLSFIFALLGNKDVLDSASRAAQEADELGMKHSRRLEFLGQKGGVSLVGAGIAMVLQIFLIFAGYEGS
ncbi:MAG: DUF2628 domain-containing protein [Alphaproteobacteria bacterium]|nr:DUF2628 domain-containing protein [Alphaproteobacteria bacterium]